jgi:ethanolamine utilization protein EutN
VDVVDGQGNVVLAHQVAADPIGAGEGEWVLLVHGSSARMIMESKTPLDLSVVGIVDQVTSGKTALYNKSN